VGACCPCGGRAVTGSKHSRRRGPFCASPMGLVVGTGLCLALACSNLLVLWGSSYYLAKCDPVFALTCVQTVPPPRSAFGRPLHALSDRMSGMKFGLRSLFIFTSAEAALWWPCSTWPVTELVEDWNIAWVDYRYVTRPPEPSEILLRMALCGTCLAVCWFGCALILARRRSRKTSSNQHTTPIHRPLWQNRGIGRFLDWIFGRLASRPTMTVSRAWGGVGPILTRRASEGTGGLAMTRLGG
jgi:hypothetical protein